MERLGNPIQDYTLADHANGIAGDQFLLLITRRATMMTKTIRLMNPPSAIVQYFAHLNSACSSSMSKSVIIANGHNRRNSPCA
jgi:hypothetical protein